MKSVSLAVCLLVGAVGTQLSAQDSAVAQATNAKEEPAVSRDSAQNPGKRIICRTDDEIGSRVHKRRICMTRDEWREVAQQSGMATERKSVSVSKPGGG